MAKYYNSDEQIINKVLEEKYTEEEISNLKAQGGISVRKDLKDSVKRKLANDGFTVVDLENGETLFINNAKKELEED